jgi:hypothetical protein
MHTLNQQWGGDFWEHAAVVRELARRPWAPQHPLFAIDAPHPFISPYALAAALVSRVSAAHPIHVLAACGVVNVIALLVSFRLFAGTVVGRQAALFALLFTLVLWGSDPWRYSGFIHLNALGFVAAYPSTLALVLTLLSLYALRRALDDGGWRWTLLVACAAPVVLVTHPITGIVLGAGLVAFSARALLTDVRRVLVVALCVMLTSIAGVLLWPYYPWLDLIAVGSDVYAEPNLAMYDGVLGRTWPILIAVPLVVRRMMAAPLDGLALFVVILSVLYALGAVLQNGPLGRVLPALVLGLHLILADALARMLSSPSGASRQMRPVVISAIAALMLFGVFNTAPGLIRAVPRALLPAGARLDARLERVPPIYWPLVPHIGPDAVVMADINISRHLPAFAGKVIGFIDPEAFVPDEHARREALFRFFGDATLEERRALLREYGAEFIAVDLARAPLTAADRADLTALGTVVYDDGRMMIVRVSAMGETAGGAAGGRRRLEWTPAGAGGRARGTQP